MFELSDYLVGIYKVTDCTNSVTIQNDPPKFHHSSTQQQSQSFFNPNLSLQSDPGLDQSVPKDEKTKSKDSLEQSDSQKENVPEPVQQAAPASQQQQQPMEVSVEAN